jgi:2-polyprenyl-3-methyl-5-hydroxy-6-metoxy-1,4-benzoquinol methylase
MSGEDDPLRTIAGHALTADHVALLRGGTVLRFASMARTAAPIRDGDIVEIARPLGLARGDIVLCAERAPYRLVRLLDRRGDGWLARDEPGGRTVELRADAIAGVVVATEQSDLRFELRRGRWRACAIAISRLPAGTGRVVTGLAYLERARRPFFAPLYMGSPEELLAFVGESYTEEADALAAAEGLSEEEQVMVERYLRKGMRLLDVGCGAGREAIGLARAGLDVTGIDLSERMVELARKRLSTAGVSARFAVADPLTFASPRPFDVVYLTPGVYAHIPTRARRVATLRHLADLLTPDGFILFAPVLYQPLPWLTRARFVDGVRRLARACGVRRVSEPGDWYHRGLSLGPWPRSFRYVHRFTNPADISQEVALAGLAVTDTLDESLVWVLRRAVT